MKEIKNWEALIWKNGKYQRALPLSGCYIAGEVDGEKKIFKISAIDFSKLIIQTVKNEYYLLDGARISYLELLEDLIQFSKENKSKKEKDSER